MDHDHLHFPGKFLRSLGEFQGLSRRELLALVLHFCRTKAEQVQFPDVRLMLPEIYGDFMGDFLGISWGIFWGF